MYIKEYAGIKLPEHLSEEELLTLHTQYKEGNEKALEELTLRNLKLIIIQVNNINPPFFCDEEDLLQVGIEGYIKGINSFDNTKGKFNAYTMKCVRNEIGMYLRKLKKHEKTCFFEDGLVITKRYDDSLSRTNIQIDENPFFVYVGEPSVCERIEQKETYEEVRKSLDLLDEVSKEIIYLYFYKNKNTIEIAEELGISQPHISRKLKKSRILIKKHMEDKCLFGFKNMDDVPTLVHEKIK